MRKMPEFWTPARIERARSLRWMRRLWAACSTSDQARFEAMVYRMRGGGVEESVIRKQIEEAIELRRSWRMSDAKLGRALARIYAQRRA